MIGITIVDKTLGAPSVLSTFFLEVFMNTNLKNKFLKFLLTSFGSALIMSIYSIVDAVCVGQYHGESGTAALATIMPLWTLIYSSGLLFGIGGATLLSSSRGRKDFKKANEYFTISFIGALAVSIILWLTLFLFQDNLLNLFGAKNEEVFSLAKDYTFWMKLALPLFLSTQYFAAFVRNDGEPLRATIAVIIGGVFNIFGDIFFVFDFGLGMGISGAGLATMLGQIFTDVILLTHFFSKKNTLRFTKVNNIFVSLKSVFLIGFPVFLIDMSMGILTILFNNQIVHYLGSSAEGTATLAIYGVICNIIALIQSFAYAVGQASQPLLAESFGATKYKDINKLLKYGIVSVIIISILCFILMEAIPTSILKLFISVEEGSLSLSLAPKIIRIYFICSLFMIFNVYSTYYFQSILKARTSFLVSMLRGVVLSLTLLYLIPLIFGFDQIWYTIPLTELLTLIFVVIFMVKYTKAFKNSDIIK